jgi:hypothetical protein
MPLPEKYQQELIESRAAAERASRWDEWRELARVLGEMALSTALGMALVFMAFWTSDVRHLLVARLHRVDRRRQHRGVVRISTG